MPSLDGRSLASPGITSNPAPPPPQELLGSFSPKTLLFAVFSQLMSKSGCRSRESGLPKSDLPPNQLRSLLAAAWRGTERGLQCELPGGREYAPDASSDGWGA